MDAGKLMRVRLFVFSIKRFIAQNSRRNTLINVELGNAIRLHGRSKIRENREKKYSHPNYHTQQGKIKRDTEKCFISTNFYLFASIHLLRKTAKPVITESTENYEYLINTFFLIILVIFFALLSLSSLFENQLLLLFL